jgi:hypothetical protein
MSSAAATSAPIAPPSTPLTTASGAGPERSARSVASRTC